MTKTNTTPRAPSPGRTIISSGRRCESCHQLIPAGVECNYHNFLGQRHFECVGLSLAPPSPIGKAPRDPNMPVEHPWAHDEED